MPKMSLFGLQDTGRIRENNEDRWLVDDSLSVAIVADGMGGAASGEIAAAMTVEEVVGYFRDPEPGLSPEQVAKEAIRAANDGVRKRSKQEISCRGMGSTIVMAHWTLPRVVIANVGDSRAYLWRRGQLRQLSYDQTLINDLRQSGLFSDEQLEGMANKNVLTMAIGTKEEVLIHTWIETLSAGDQILLCTDGLWSFVPEDAISEVLRDKSDAAEILKELVARANTAGGEDNVTVVLLCFEA